MVQLPASTAVILPRASTVATASEEEANVTFLLLASLGKTSHSIW